MINKIIKYFSLIFISIIFISLNLLSVSAETASISITAPESVNIGRSFNVNFVVDNASVKISAIKLTIKYNEEYLSLKSAQCASQGEVQFYADNGTTVLICLYTKGIPTSDNFLTLTFTAKTGQSSSNQAIEFICNEAVDTDLNDASVTLTNKVSIQVIKSGDDNSGGSLTSRSATSSSRTSSISSKTSSQNSKTSTSKGNVYESQTELSGNIIKNEDNYYTEDEQNSGENGLPSFGDISGNNSKMHYILSGIGIGVAVVVLLLLAFRVGQISRRNVTDDDNGKKSKDDK